MEELHIESHFTEYNDNKGIQFNNTLHIVFSVFLFTFLLHCFLLFLHCRLKKGQC